MKKYTKTIRRLTMQDCPLSPGSIAICFTEDNKNGQTFSDWISEILDADSVKTVQQRNDVLQLKYLINVEITSAADIESLQDLRVGLAKLDKKSVDFRLELTTDDKEKVKESARRSVVNLHVKGLYDIAEFAQEFDLCNVDISDMSVEDISNSMIYVAALAQRPNPTVYTISTDFANDLADPDFKETVVKKTFEAKIKMKSVFAKEEGLKNDFVRAL